MNTLLTVLEEEIETLESGADFDSNLTIAILDYIKYYPDIFHRPLEELIFDRLCLHGAVIPVIDELRDDHVKLGVRTSEYRVIFTRWQQEGGLSDRARAGEFGRAYIDAQRRHIAREERDLFPRAIQVLAEADWAAVSDYADACSPIADPVFGSAVVERYGSIRNRIRQRPA